MNSQSRQETIEHIADILPSGDTSTYFAALGNAVMILGSTYWAYKCYKSIVRAGGKPPATLLALAIGWTVASLDSLALLIHSLTYMQCPSPFRFIRPALSECVSSAFLMVRDFTQPLAVALVSAGAISRFISTLHACGEQKTKLFLKLGCIVTAFCVLAKLVLASVLVPVAVNHRLNSFNQVYWQEKTSTVAIIPFYTVIASWQVLAVWLGSRRVHQLFMNSFTTIHDSRRFSDGTLQPQINIQKKHKVMKWHERRYLIIVSVMLASSTTLLIAYVFTFHTDWMLDAWISAPMRAFVYSAFTRVFGHCMMIAMNAMGGVFRSQLAQNSRSDSGDLFPCACRGLANSSEDSENV